MSFFLAAVLLAGWTARGQGLLPPEAENILAGHISDPRDLIALFERGFDTGDFSVFQKVIQQPWKANNSEKPRMLESLIGHVLYQGSAARLRKLHELGVDLNVKLGDFKRTPLHGVRDAESAALLIELGLDPNAIDADGDTPLAVLARPWDGKPAATSSTLAILEVLRAHGAKVDPVSKGLAETPIFHASNPAILAWLLDHGANPNHRDALGRTALAFQGYWEKNLDLLLAHGANVEERDVAGMTPLLQSILAARPRPGWFEKPIANLLARGADAKAAANDGETALHIAARAKLHQFVKPLIEKGAGPKQADKLGRTPLHFCLMRPLIDAGLDINQTDHFGQTPLHMLAALHEDIRPDFNNEVMLDLDSLRAAYPKLKINVNAADKAGRTPLHWAVLTGKNALARQLLEAGADPAAKDRLGRSPADLAVDIHKLFVERSTEERRNFDPSRKTDIDPGSFRVSGADLNNDGLIDLVVRDPNLFDKSGQITYTYFGQEDGSFRFAPSQLSLEPFSLPLDVGKGLVRSDSGRNRWATISYDLYDGFSVKPFLSWTVTVGY